MSISCFNGVVNKLCHYNDHCGDRLKQLFVYIVHRLALPIVSINSVVSCMYTVLSYVNPILSCIQSHPIDYLVKINIAGTVIKHTCVCLTSGKVPVDTQLVVNA